MTTKLTGLPLVETSDNQLFVLITGANGALGFGIASRLIDEYLTLTKDSTTKKLILIICTRSSKQSQLSISRLRTHIERFVKSSPFADQKRAEAEAQCIEYRWQEILQRVVFLGVEADFCNLKSVYALSDKLINHYVGSQNLSDSCAKGLPMENVSHDGNASNLNFKDDNDIYHIPRLDVVVFTAGIGGWTGVKFDLLFKEFFCSPIEAMTRPRYKKSKVGALVRPQSAYSATRNLDKATNSTIHGEKLVKEPPLGEVFSSNLFGQYLLAHELMPLLSQPPTSNSQHGGKIIWVSSIAIFGDSFSFDDFQGLRSLAPYESSKRLMDLLMLPCENPSVSNHAASFFDVSRTVTGKKENKKAEFNQKNSKLVRPRNYVVHPGIFQSNILPIPFLVALICKFIFYVTRWLGSPWHTIDSYTAAISPVQIALVDHKSLDEVSNNRSTNIKWGSATDIAGNAEIRKTEVPDWGYDGNTDTIPNADTKYNSTKSSDIISKHSIQTFESLSAKCWTQIESLREEWEAILGLSSSS